MHPQHLPAFVTALEPFIRKYGVVGVAGLLFLEDFGVLVPGETVLIASAVYSGLGQLNILLVVLAGFVGAVLGDNVGFAIGRYGGHPLVERFGKYIFLTPERIGKAEAFFKRNGGKVVLVARFIDGLRQANGIIAGLSGMEWVKFLIFNAIGALLWVGVWSALGYFGGDHIETFIHYQLYFTITAAVLLAGFIVYKVIKKKREKA